MADVPSDTKTGRAARRNALVIYKCTQHDLQSQIDALRETPGFDLTSQARDSMEMAGLAKIKWLSDRKSLSSRKAGAAFQASMSSFSQFLDNFSGIAEIAKSADQQYGGLAFGTLSLMLSIFVHKTQREQALDEGFAELALALPRLQTLQNLRQEGMKDDLVSFERLEALVMTTFCQIIKLARETAEYYSSKSRRIKDAMLPEQKKNANLIDVRNTLCEIRNECDILMLTRITTLHQKLEAISVDVRKTRVESAHAGSQLRRARESSDTSHLAELRQILGVQELSANVNVKKYKSLLASAFFSGSALRSKYCRPKKISMELLRGEGEFDKWWASSKSCLLLAGGSNFVDDHSSGSLNWLSYGAILAIEELRLQDRNVAFFLAQTSWSVNERKRCTIRQIIVNLIYQISAMHDDLLRSKIDRLKAAVQSAAWNENNGDAFWLKAQPLLLEIFSTFSCEEEIFIVVDRLDQCAWSEYEDEYEEDEDDSSPSSSSSSSSPTGLDMCHAIEELLHIAAEAHCHVKILLTMDAASSQKVARGRSRMSKKERKVLLLKAEWCQATDEGRSDE